MVLPLVPLVIVIGGSVTGAGGVVAGTVGGVQIWGAQARLRFHSDRYEVRYATHLKKVDRTIEALRTLGQTQERALCDVIFRMRDFLVRHAKQVRAQEHLVLDGFDSSSIPVIGMAKLDTDVASWVQGVIASVVAGHATRSALQASVVELAKASTGTAISTLRGAAAKNATLAFLGGGSLVAGGGGMALGATMLNVATAGPTILTTGLMVKNQGAKARASADRLRTDVDVAIAHIDTRDQLLRGVHDRACELNDILSGLISAATAAVDLLESEPFDIDDDLQARQLQTALILVKSVREIATAPVADDGYTLNEGTEQLIFTYRDLRTEAGNV